MQRGRVKWFNDLKGFGFIEGTEAGKDIFVHHSVIESNGYRSLLDGEEVLYEVTMGPKGPAASRVIKVSEGEKAAEEPSKQDEEPRKEDSTEPEKEAP